MRNYLCRYVMAGAVLVLVQLCLISGVNAQAPSFRWAMEGVGSGGYDAANGVAVDAAGNVFVTGGIASSNVLFGGQIFAGYITPANYYPPLSQFFITKLDAFGNVLWVRQGGAK